MTKAKGYQVGQKVWATGHGWAGERTVTKVGRKWVYMGDGQRFDAKSGDIDGGDYMSPGRVYKSEDAWVRHQENLVRNFAFRRALRCMSHVPDIGKAELRDICEKLGVLEVYEDILRQKGVR